MSNFFARVCPVGNNDGCLNTCLVPDVAKVVCNDEKFIISTPVNESSFFLHPHGCTILLTACFDEYLIFIM